MACIIAPAGGSKSVHYSPLNESPILRRLAAEGLIPAVQDRMPSEPVVYGGPDGLGRYGGVWRRLSDSTADVALTIRARLGGAGLVRWAPQG